MKKTFLMIFLICWAASSTSFAATSAEPFLGAESQEHLFRKGKKTKSGRYKKRGGLFGKKNDCGCPKH